MGPANPWSPNWRPDPTGHRVEAIRSSRRGAFWAGVLLWPLVLIATLTTPGALDQEGLRIEHVVLIALLSWPGLALLGAGLAPTAVGSRTDALAAGLALGVGAPIAAIASTMIGVAIVWAVLSTGPVVGEAVGTTIRLGVLGAIRFAPLVAAAVIVWIFVVRRFQVRATS